MFPDVLLSHGRLILGQRVKALAEEKKIDFVCDCEKTLN